MINRVILVGRLTKGLELRYTPNGKAVATGTIAVNRPFKQNGQNEADYIQIVIWGKSAENAANFLSKGSLVGIDGRIQTRSYENNEGKRIYITEVVTDGVQFLEPKNSRNSNVNNQEYSNSRNQSKSQNGQSERFPDPFANDGKPIDISDDDLPF